MLVLLFASYLCGLTKTIAQIDAIVAADYLLSWSSLGSVRLRLDLCGCLQVLLPCSYSLSGNYYQSVKIAHAVKACLNRCALCISSVLTRMKVCLRLLFSHVV